MTAGHERRPGILPEVQNIRAGQGREGSPDGERACSSRGILFSIRMHRKNLENRAMSRLTDVDKYRPTVAQTTRARGLGVMTSP